MRVSAYIPAYNSAGTLADAIASVRGQTRPVDELFVVDDGSADLSVELAEGLQVRVIRQLQNRGRGSTRALALATARHELVLGCDACVRLAPDFLEQALNWFKEPSVGAVCGRITDASTRTATERWRCRHLFKTDLHPVLDRRASLATGGALLNRAAVLEAGNFNVNLAQDEDQDLGQRLLRAGYEVIFDPRLRLVALGSNSVWQTFERYRRWNVPPRPVPSWSDYLRQIAYSIKVMLRQDLRRRDLGAAGLSLLWPLYLFWKTRPLTRLSRAGHRTHHA